MRIRTAMSTDIAMSTDTAMGTDKAADLVNNRGLEYGLRSLLKTCALLMGLSWEATFNQGVHAIGLKYEGSTRTLVIVLLTTATCLVVLPAWAMYIVPYTVEDDFEQKFLADEDDHGEHVKEKE